MGKNKIAYFTTFAVVLVLFSSCGEKLRPMPIASIPYENYSINYEYYNNELIMASNSQGQTFYYEFEDITPFLQLQEIVPYQDIFTAPEIESSVMTVLPIPSPYDRLAPQENLNPVGIVPVPAAAMQVSKSNTSSAAAASPSNVRSAASTQPAVQSNTGAQNLYRVQVGSFTNTVNVQHSVARLRTAGFSPVLEQSGAYTRVVIPCVESKNLTSVIKRLENAGFKDPWVRREP